MKKRNFIAGIFKSILVALLFLIEVSFSFSLYAQQVNPNLRAQPQIERRITIPPELLRQSLVTVPLLKGRLYERGNIEAFLDRYGLLLGDALPVMNADSVGIILSQSPTVRQRVIRDTRVNITYGVSLQIVTPGQPENVSVFNYIGMQVERAVDRMPNDRVEPGQISEMPADAPLGEVVSQFPEAEMIVDPGTRINLTVSSGPQQVDPVRVPPLKDLTLEQAAEVLRGTGLFAGQLREEMSDRRQGVVLGQFPEAGTLVPPGSAVDIIYAVQAPDERVPVDFVNVPDVTNLPRDKAIIVLKNSRLNYLLRYESRPGEPKEMVLEQNPLPETRVPVGSDVELTIAKKEEIPPWVYFGAGVLAAGLIGGYLGRKFSGRKRKPLAEKDISLKLKPVLDTGKQSISKSDNEVIQDSLHLKFVPDAGTQTINTD